MSCTFTLKEIVMFSTCSRTGVGRSVGSNDGLPVGCAVGG